MIISSKKKKKKRLADPDPDQLQNQDLSANTVCIVLWETRDDYHFKSLSFRMICYTEITLAPPPISKLTTLSLSFLAYKHSNKPMSQDYKLLGFDESPMPSKVLALSS